MKIVLIIIACSIGAVVAAMFFGRLAGIYQAHREASFRRRAIKLMGVKGQAEEFLLISGDATLVSELYQVVVATTARARDIQAAKANNEGVALDDRQSEEEQDTDRPGRA